MILCSGRQMFVAVIYQLHILYLLISQFQLTFEPVYLIVKLVIPLSVISLKDIELPLQVLLQYLPFGLLCFELPVLFAYLADPGN